MAAKLLLSLPILDIQNNLDSEPYSIPVIKTNSDIQHFNLPSRSISLLAVHNSNYPNYSTFSIQSRESSTTMRKEVT
jgi:hypothetical protein